MNKKQVGAWALFDFANSVYPAVMTTAVFPVFFILTVVGSEGGNGELWWGRAVSISALIVAISSPLLGAIADRGGARKKFMLFYTAVCLIGVALMSTLGEGMVIKGVVGSTGRCNVRANQDRVRWGGATPPWAASTWKIAPGTRSSARPMSLSDSPCFHRVQTSVFSAVDIRGRRTRSMTPPPCDHLCVASTH